MISDYDWSVIDKLITLKGTKFSYEQSRVLFVSLYVFVTIKDLHKQSPGDGGQVDTARIDIIREKMMELDNRFLHSIQDGQLFHLYTETKVCSEIIDLLDLPNDSYFIVPHPFLSDGQDSQAQGCRSIMATSVMFLWRDWALAHMVVKESFCWYHKKIKVSHKHICSCLNDNEIRALRAMHQFSRNISLTPSKPLRILLAIPHESIQIERESGKYFYPRVLNSVEANLDLEARDLISYCSKEKVDIIVLPEMFVTEEIRKPFETCLKDRKEPDDGKYYPWLVVAGSSHVDITQDGTVTPRNRVTVLNPFGRVLFTSDKICPMPSEEPGKTAEDIVPGDAIQLIDIPFVGRILVCICRDYLEIYAAHNALDTIWPTLIFVPSCSRALKPFNDGALWTRKSYGASVVVVNAPVRQTNGNPSTPVDDDELICVISSERSKYRILPEKIEIKQMRFWTNLFFVELWNL